MQRNKTVTYKGMATLYDDEATKLWFYPALARAVPRMTEMANASSPSSSTLPVVS